jgi:hypothetical protein
VGWELSESPLLYHLGDKARLGISVISGGRGFGSSSAGDWAGGK